MNQAPVLIAMLMDKKITGKDGTEMSVWNAMKSDGTFIENFATDENNKTWVNAETTEFTHFKSKVDGAIKNIHGDYTTLGAPMSSDNQAFRSVMMSCNERVPRIQSTTDFFSWSTATKKGG